MNATEKLVDDILADRIAIKDLDLLQMEAVIDFMRENISEISAESDDEEQYLRGLLTLIDLIQDAAEHRFEAEATGAWDAIVEASVARGNSYFELEQYTLH